MSVPRRSGAERLRATVIAITALATIPVWLSLHSISSSVARDFEECAEWAHNVSPAAERAARIMNCGARFSGRRKPGGGYTYYDLLQNRSFDIAGPNPTAQERTRIDLESMHFIDLQWREAAFAAVEKTQLAEFENTPALENLRLPARPSIARSKADSCIKGRSLSCGWTKVTAAVKNSFASTYGPGVR
jgi:hypothetical protein